MAPTTRLAWRLLLHEAVTTPGLILEAYTAFHRFSLGNQLAALTQCRERGIRPGPIATYAGWQAKGRQVRRGARALILCMPVTITAHRRDKDDLDADNESESGKAQTVPRTVFIWKPRWFVLSQTDGDPVTVEPPEAWDKAAALTRLGVSEIPFDELDGNCQGYAIGRSVAISPIAQLPFKTLFHELGHILLGHTESAPHDPIDPPRALKEGEAEGVALLVLEALGLPGAAYCRGYIQAYLSDLSACHTQAGAAFLSASAYRIIQAADAILRAGRPTSSAEEFPDGNVIGSVGLVKGGEAHVQPTDR
ncbi:MAG: DUF1738 domain-containing protein [Candidatus Methylomirabilota bacterium]|nr:ArdC family protein [Candidatus Methylomirabilis sp.]NJD68057.1 DUF1738 domain-containing protein [candidate division NC10 bacterium]PWB47252.1 MAG: DUF1738 domain-containing protein [candidate division NC10 bacterium]